MAARWVVDPLALVGLAGLALVWTPAAAAAEEEPARVVDLTQELTEGIPTFPGGVAFQRSPEATFETSGYLANRLELGEHTGTHVDAPLHFHPGGGAIDALPLDHLVAPGIRVSIEEQVSASPDATLDAEDLDRWEQANGAIPKGAVVLVQTGWSRRWPHEADYRNADPQGVMHFPGLSEPAAQWLAQRRVAAVGIDTLSIDPGASTDFAAHRILSEAGIPAIENLTNLDGLPEAGFTVIVAPLKIRGGSGSPARILAILGEAD